ncbi:MAG: peptidase M28 family protein [Alphaproteobacteria bacterium 64-11]|nr:M20/M25/M40 family metallo-hydrolase [Alphaproteobacteria bacterium]OJU09178.1 MAG: peptidase M28 family protein [Alphaproteobacteria bacterium 64-11]
MTPHRIFATGLLLAAFTLPAFADPAAAIRARDRALADDTAWNIVQSLTSEIGPRPAGSDAAARARDWGLAEFKAMGFSNIHLEPFAKHAWLRGAESGEILTPYPHKLALIGLGLSVPTPSGGMTGEVLVFPSLADLQNAPADCCTGKIVLVNQPMTRTQDITGYGTAVAARSAAHEAAKHGAIAYLVRSISTASNRSPHAGAMQPWAPGEKPIPAAAIGVPDADAIAYLAKSGPVRVHLNLQSRFVDTTAWNVVGEIPGSDPGAGAIVIGGHLDSWDPGTGAIDDAAGIAITLAAARLVEHPKRTIRVVMWGSEETGGSGAAYLEAHKNELSSIAIAGESDLGADRVFSLQLPAGAWDNDDIKPLRAILAPLKVIPSTVPAEDGGSDVENIHAAGVPVLALNQDASRYFDYHHSADDTLAVVDPAQLRQNVAAWAATLDMLADSAADFRKGMK